MQKDNTLIELNKDIPILEAKHLVYEYRTAAAKTIRAVYDVSFNIWPGEFIGLIGHTGSGKSTLLQLLTALEEPASVQYILRGRIFLKKNMTGRGSEGR